MTGAGSTNSERRQLRILVVEDTVLIADAIKRLLEDVGCRVVGPMGSLDEAMAAAESEDVDGALLDVNVRGLSIYPAADRLAARRIPIVFMTGYSARSLPEAYRTVPCLEKPFARAELERALAREFGYRRECADG